MDIPIGSSGAATSERRFFTGMALAILAVVLVGFSRSFFLRPLYPDWPAPSEGIFYVHGAAFTAWILLFLVQASLVAGGRTDLHRKIGPFGVALAAAMVVLGVLGALIAARRATGFTGVPVPPLQFLAIPIFDVVMFSGFVALGILGRRNAQRHKRLMLLATISIITAAIARWPGVLPLGPLVFFGLTDLFVVALGVWDFRTRGRLHPVTLWGGVALIASQLLRLVVSGTDAWLAFARWATGLLG
ncbi:MAG: hypothetical protein ABI920_14550 [Casimicrobiaceae bacterium]